MSSYGLKLIPKDPKFRPGKAAAKKAAEHLHALLPDGEMWDVEFHDRQTFIDQGDNLSTIICPRCKKRLKPARDEVTADWWSSVSESVVATRKIRMLCCGARVPFSTLKFDWPAGFARFELFIWNPNIRKPLPARKVAELERILGCQLVQILAMY